MRTKDRVKNDYFEWMYDLVGGGRYSPSTSFRQLFTFLHDVEFTYFIPHDENRVADGIDLRYRYCYERGREDLEVYLDGPCSVLEMMIALALKCEEFMDDPHKGNRTSQWFWTMISSLGLNAMTDTNFNEWLVSDVIGRFLNRDYDRDGNGGLFYVRGWDRDMRKIEIWHQLLAYINTIV